jgi:hypothetical protein
MIGPCGIPRKFSEVAFELGSIEEFDISPIFNMSHLYEYKTVTRS